ncbi:dTDP-glucose 4,6-dehydratase [Candidatus Nomurabacteria bacterium]|nr:dTDP-glucose 4,6-dehydratase [Candidatus Nomurabacteria bacterium]
MKLLVTGGSGFIGANFIDHWLRSNPEDMVINLDLMTYCANPITVTQAKDKWGPRYKFVYGDICNEEDVRKAMKDCGLVVHFAAESHVDRSIEDPELFIETNVKGTALLLRVAHELGSIRFHHVSTDEVWGSLELDTDERFNENRRYDPRTPYAASKASSDHIVRSFFETYSLPVTISNCTNNYGPYQFPEKVIPLFILRLLQGQQIPVYGDGLSERDYLYVEDHCIALEMIIKKGRVGQSYCIGGNNSISSKLLAEELVEKLCVDKDLIKYTRDRKGHDRKYAVDTQKITSELDWTPQTTFHTGLEKTIEWYKCNADWWENLWPEAQKVAEKYLSK